jgi:hypothetical protein
MSTNVCDQIPVCKPTPFKIEKTACPDFFTEAGDIITYIYTVTYDASYPVSQIVLNDNKLGQQSVTINNSGFCSSASVFLHQQFVNNYTITEADIQTGEPIINTATATIVFADGSSITLSSVTATATFGQAFVTGNLYSYFDPIQSDRAIINLDINNAGPSKAKGITVTLKYPEGITANDITVLRGNIMLGTDSLTIFIDNIDPGFGLGYQFAMNLLPDIIFYNWTGSFETATVNTNPNNTLHLLIEKISHGPFPPVCKPDQVTAEWQLQGPIRVTQSPPASGQQPQQDPQQDPQPEPLVSPTYQVTFSLVKQPPALTVTKVKLVSVTPMPPPIQQGNTFIFTSIPMEVTLTIDYSYNTPIGSILGSQSFDVRYNTNTPDATITQFFCVP